MRLDYILRCIGCMAFGVLLLLRFKVTESCNDIKLKNHMHTRAAIKQWNGPLSTQTFHTIFNLVDKFILLENPYRTEHLNKSYNTVEKKTTKIIIL